MYCQPSLPDLFQNVEKIGEPEDEAKKNLLYMYVCRCTCSIPIYSLFYLPTSLVPKHSEGEVLFSPPPIAWV